MIKQLIKINIFLIYALIISLIGGSYLTIGTLMGIELSAFRVVLIISFFYLLVTKQLRFYNDKFSAYVLCFLIGWLLYSLVSLLWTPVLLYGVKEVFYLLIGIISYLIFYSLYRILTDFIELIERIWIQILIVVLGCLMLELITQRHLSGEYFEKLIELGTYHKSNFIPIFTFFNPNVLAIYLCISIVFLIRSIVKNKNVLFNITLLFLCFDLIYLTESRFGFICSLLIICISFVINFLRTIRRSVHFKVAFPKILFIGVLMVINGYVIVLEKQLLEGPFCGTLASTQIQANLYLKQDQKLCKDGLILLTSHPDLLLKKTEPKVDIVLGIDRTAYFKLLDDKTIKLSYREINQNEHSHLFFGNSFSLILLLATIFICCIIIYFYQLLQDRNQVFMMSFLLVLVALFFCFNKFENSSSHYKKKILVSESKRVNEITFEDVEFISVSSHTGRLLLDNRQLECRLIQKSDLRAIQSIEITRLGSNLVRKNLILNGWDYLKSSHYLGVGAGGFQGNNSLKKNKYPDGGIMTAHNFIIEIVSQYGIIIFFAFIGIITWIMVDLFVAFKVNKWVDNHFVVFGLMIVLWIMGNANSSFLSLPLNWIIMILLFIFSIDVIKIRKIDNEH